jgi:hypothetical protein
MSPSPSVKLKVSLALSPEKTTTGSEIIGSIGYVSFLKQLERRIARIKIEKIKCNFERIRIFVNKINSTESKLLIIT